MKQIILTTGFTLLLAGTLCLSGCSGSSDNSVSAPPEKVPTAEELEAQYKSTQQDYAEQQKKMQQRDRGR